jgi:hypothetical protein
VWRSSRNAARPLWAALARSAVVAGLIVVALF